MGRRSEALKSNARTRARTAHQQDTERRVRSLEKREWDLAAKIRECALEHAREQANVLLTARATDRVDLQARDTRFAGLDSQIEDYRADHMRHYQ